MRKGRKMGLQQIRALGAALVALLSLAHVSFLAESRIQPSDRFPNQGKTMLDVQYRGRRRFTLIPPAPEGNTMHGREPPEPCQIPAPDDRSYDPGNDCYYYGREEESEPEPDEEKPTWSDDEPESEDPEPDQGFHSMRAAKRVRGMVASRMPQNKISPLP